MQPILDRNQILIRIVPGKRLSPRQRPPLNFDSCMVFEVLRVTAHHAKFLRSESKIGPLSSRT